MSNTPEHLEKVAVVMAGGRGTRFWPRSRTHRPKQFLAMVGETTLLNQTVARLHPDFLPQNIYIVTTEDLAAETRRLLPELPPENVILEPEGRNTAPCLALALAVIERKHPQGVMVVLSADHWITDNRAFLADIEVASRHAWEKHELVTFGIRPAYPETGYGYIETVGQGAVLAVKAFREKPPLPTAMEYVQTGRHFWNAGMFVWTLADMRRELQAHCPEVLAPLDAWVAAGADPTAMGAAYAQLPKLSIDYALMEKSSHVAVVPATFGWSDVGSWPAVVEFHEPDAEGNVIQGEAVLVDSTNCAIFGGRRMIAGSGLKDLIVVDEADALLICHREKAQGVKDIVERLQKLGRKDLL
jgi:mannose-1-phosphate guanylyltransferase